MPSQFRFQCRQPSLPIYIGALVILCLAFPPIALAGPSVFPTGVTAYNPSEAYNCDVLFSAGGNTYLIDMNGNVLHRWDYAGFPARMLDPALTGGEKGEIGVQLSVVPARNAKAIGLVPGLPAQFRDRTFGYADWSGKILWQWGTQAPGGAALQHHDWRLLANGDTLLLSERLRRLPDLAPVSCLIPLSMK